MRPVTRVARHVALLPFLLVAAIPIYILIISAFKTNADIAASPLSLPFGRLTLDNVVGALTNPSLAILPAFLRSIAITVGSVGLSTIAAGMIAFVIARSVKRWVAAIYVVLVAGILIPSQVLLIPVVRILQFLQLDGSLPGLILYMAATQLPLAIFLYVGFMRSVPTDLDEAASLDGAGVFRTYWQIIFPIIRPATASILIFNGLGAFNDFVDPLIILGPTGGNTVTTGVYTTIGQYSINYGSVFGNLFVAVIPVLVAYVFLQRQFIEGLSDGSVKG